jgi:hypothetical protein
MSVHSIFYWVLGALSWRENCSGGVIQTFYLYLVLC